MPRFNDFRRAQGMDDRFVVLFAGNIGLSQGLERVLEAAELLKGRPEIVFLMVGDGAAKPALLDLSERLRLRNVVFRPFFPYADIPEMYAASDICLVPLKKGITEESVPSKVFSILAAARPLVASVDEGSDTWQLVKESGSGLCIPPEDPKALAEAIMTLHQDQPRAVQMGEKGRAYVVEHFSRKMIAKKYEQLFKKVTGQEA
jgi:colanic acid biosynthesis glycosyl transferase WcaI